VANFVYSATLNFQCDFSAKRFAPDTTWETLYVKSLPAP